MHKHPKTLHGITLVEAMVTLAILSIVAGTAMPSFQSMIARQRLEGVAVQLATDLQYARTETVARNEPLRLSFWSDEGGSCYAIHTGSHAQCSCSGAAPAVCSGDAVEIKTVYVPAAQQVTVQANVASILYDPRHGTSTPAGTARVAGAPGAINHVVNVMGRVRSCSPDGSFPAYHPC